jgi:hypothetical protein
METKLTTVTLRWVQFPSGLTQEKRQEKVLRVVVVENQRGVD